LVLKVFPKKFLNIQKGWLIEFLEKESSLRIAIIYCHSERSVRLFQTMTIVGARIAIVRVRISARTWRNPHSPWFVLDFLSKPAIMVGLGVATVVVGKVVGKVIGNRS
jgi:hypothetical protein